MKKIKEPAACYIVAVSGGIDSVVLLDMLSKKKNLELVVAHFDHGIRDDSHLDAEFVKNLSIMYNLPFESKREELGREASEEIARDCRYRFLREIAAKYNGIVVTAHHSDDVVETIAINLLRGTGWRGLAVLDSDITRPLTHLTKKEILSYAKKHKLRWRDDSTNASDKYLRNRVRLQTAKMSDDEKLQVLCLWETQKDIKKVVDQEVRSLVGDGPSYSRYFFTHVGEASAIECLRCITGARLTRPQMLKLLFNIKTIKAGKKYTAGGGVKINFTSRNFTVELLK
ncbi:MAG: tRNA lysidine(34) synthetase TilS [Candidatus Saccharibacteria bacterium]